MPNDMIHSFFFLIYLDKTIDFDYKCISIFKEENKFHYKNNGSCAMFLLFALFSVFENV